MSEKKNEGKKIIAQNRKAYHDYFVDETYEAGIALFGTEVRVQVLVIFVLVYLLTINVSIPVSILRNQGLF